MKRGAPLRKRSKSKATIDKADRALQDWFRATYPNNKCEVCGGQFQVMHHHIEKSKSNAGRYEHDNLIFICHSCHSKITFGYNNVIATYSAKRGIKWVEKMQELSKISKQYYTKGELEVIMLRYSLENLL